MTIGLRPTGILTARPRVLPLDETFPPRWTNRCFRMRAGVERPLHSDCFAPPTMISDTHPKAIKVETILDSRASQTN
jgi:hypothetical protein